MRRISTTPKPATLQRRGIATLWIIAAGPALLALFVLVTDIANIWLARVQAENAVESGALAGADVWGDGVAANSGTDTAAIRTAAHNAAEALTESNLVVGELVDVDANNDAGSTNNNQVVQCSGKVLLGKYTAASENFDATTAPSSANERACRVEATVMIDSLWVGFAGPFQVRASATAAYDSGSGTAKLVRVTSGTCP